MNELRVYQLGQLDYATSLTRQVEFVDQRGPNTPDEIWCLQHNPVYTLGLAGKAEHILNQNYIPVYQTDRGGQVTYHGPGQLVVYLLLDLKRKAVSVKKYVHSLEQALIDMLEGLDIFAERNAGAPGVYVNGEKIAALGIRIRRGCCYHGISLNVNMDLSPFAGINPCGYPGMVVTQLANHGKHIDVNEAALALIPFMAKELGYENYTWLEKTQLTDHKNNLKPEALLTR